MSTSISLRRAQKVLPFLSILLLGTVAAFPQDTGTILGKVTDPTGAVIPNVRVELTNTDTNISLTTQTNQVGDYVFNLLRIGNYALRVEGQGFRTAVRSNLTLNVQQSLRADFTLQLGTLGEIIEISAESPLLETVNSSSGQVIRNKVILDLPLNGRDYQQLALLTAGTIPTGGISRGSGDFSASGARPVSNNFLLDGIDNNSYIVDLQGGTSQVAGPSVDAIQECSGPQKLDRWVKWTASLWRRRIEGRAGKTAQAVYSRIEGKGGPGGDQG